MDLIKFAKEHKFELIVLALFIFGWTLRTNVDGLFLTHPGTIKAADPFYHSLAAQVIVDERHYGYLPHYLAQGWENMIDPNPPLNYLTTASLTKVSGIPVWNVMYLMVTFFEAFGIIFLYLLASKIFNSKPIGLLAAALYVIPLGVSEWWYGMYIGLWNNVGGFFFFYASLWLAYEFWRKPSWWLAFRLSLTVSGAWLIHVAELFFIAIPAGIAFAAVTIRSWWPTKKIKGAWAGAKYALALIPVPIVSAILFWPRYQDLSWFLTAGSGGTGSFFGWYAPKLAELPFYTSLSDFPWWLLLLAGLGLLQAALNWRKYAPLLIGNAYFFVHLFILPWVMSAYYFFVRQRMALPFLIAPLVAYALYQLIVRNVSSLTKVREEVFVGILIVLLIGLAWPGYAALTPMKHSQHITPEKYDALLWLQQNTPRDAEVFFLSGYYQMSDSYAKRVAFDLDFPDFIPVLQEFVENNATIVRTEFPKTGSAGNTMMALNAIDNGTFFSYGRAEKRSPNQNITTFDYIIMADFQVGDQPFVQVYNARMIEHLTEVYGWRLVYNKNGIRIIQRGVSDEA